MMEGIETSDSFVDIVFSWSLEDILDENFYKHQVGKLGKSPQSFGSVDLQQYFSSYRYPLLDETRANLKSRMENIQEAPFGKVMSIEGCTRKLYDVEVDCWRNNVVSDEPYKTRPGDLFILADAIFETVSDLQKEGRLCVFLIATEIFSTKREDNSTSLHFRVKASKEFDVNNGIQTPFFITYLENLAPNMRIWKAMHMCTNARWKVTFSDNFLKSFKQLTSVRTKLSILSLLLKLSTGWRARKRNSEIICETSSMIVTKFRVEGLYILCSTDIIKHLRYMQVLKVWDIMPDLCAIRSLVIRLDWLFMRYTGGFIKLCCEKSFEGDMEVPMSWPASLDVVRYKDPSINIDSVDNLVKDESSVEISKVNQNLLLMKFYSLSSGVVNQFLSYREGRELILPFEVTDEEMEAILYQKSSFIVGRSGTGKTTVLSMKLYQKEEHHNMAEQGFYGAEEGSGSSDATVLRQIFVTVSPKLCFAVKQHVMQLKSFSSGGTHSAECSLFDMDDFDAEESQFSDFPDSFLDLPSKCYPLFITFRKFLMMLDGSLRNSYFDRFLEKLELHHGSLECSRSVLLQTFLRTKEVTYEKFYSSYWPHFNSQLTKKLDASRVFTEIISHIKGGLGALEASNGKCSWDCYFRMSGRTSNISEENREIIYHIFQAYEKMKMRNGEFDVCDFVNDIHRRLRSENYRGDEMDFVYIDEVQDLTLSQIALFKHICGNVDEGFVFSGDTAQTISRGIDFRFEDIQCLFYKKFVLESRSNKHEQRHSRIKISKKFHLSQNFRTHNGVLKLSQTIIDLLSYFFPQSIDYLIPETSPIHGEAPILLESGEHENKIEKLFGRNATISGNIIGFGAEQVILVRDSNARKEISNLVGKRALVLTILECKGLEFQDVILYDFFGSSPLNHQWRLIYDYMEQREWLDPIRPEKFPSFDEAKHHLLCSELKQLYVAITRTRQRLWICEKMAWICYPMLDYWNKKCLLQLRQIDDSVVEKMKVASTPEEWKMRGMKLYHQHNYEMATMCFEKACDIYWEKRSRAAGLKVLADCMQSSNPVKAKSFLREAATTFEDIGMANSAALCFFDSGDYDRAGRIYLDKCGEQGLERAAECFSLAGNYEDAADIFESIGRPDSAARCYYYLGKYERAATIYMDQCGEPGLQRAGECFSLAGCYVLAADVYARGKLFLECLTACSMGNLFDKGLRYIEEWKQNAREMYDLAIREKGTNNSELEFLERCAFHYYDEVKDIRSNMKYEREELLSSEKILNAHLSSSSSRYLWEEKSADDLKKYLEVKESKKQFSVDSLVYFWNFLKEKIVNLINNFNYLEAQDVNKKRTYGDFFLNYLGVWGDFHDDLKQVYVSLMSDASWVRGINKRYFLKNGITVNYFQIISDVRRSWSSKLICYSIKILNKLEELYKFILKKSDSVRFQSWTLNQIYVVAKMYVVAKSVLESKYLKLGGKGKDFNKLKNFVDMSAESIVACVFPLDWRKTLEGNMILLRQNDASKTLLKQLAVEYVSSTIKLSYGKVGRLAVITLGSGGVDFDFYEKLMKNLNCSRLWESFILNMCGSIIGEKKGSVHAINTQETKEPFLVRKLHQALVETYNANWRMDFDYISPNDFLYLIERLLMMVSCFQGYVVTTKSCFMEWLLQNRDAKLTSSTQANVLISFEPILMFLRDVVRDFLYDKKTTIEWIERFVPEWKEYYSLLVHRLVFILCLLYMNFGMCFDVLLDILWREHITEQLQTEFCDALRKFMYAQDSLSVNVKVGMLASAFKMAGNDLVVASFGIDCSRFFCSDSISVDMKANVWSHETLAKLLTKQHIHVPCSYSQSVAVSGKDNVNDCAGTSALAEIKSSKLLPNSFLEGDEVKNSGNLPKDFDHLWIVFEALKEVKEIDLSSLFSVASIIQLELEKVIIPFTSVCSARCPNTFEQVLPGEVMSVLDGVMQLHAALDGSEQELGNKISTVAQLCRQLQLWGERIYWPEKIEPELYFHSCFWDTIENLLERAKLETIVELGNLFTAEISDKTEENFTCQSRTSKAEAATWKSHCFNDTM